MFRIATPIRGLVRQDCDFYHRMNVPELGTVGGVWDLRAGVSAYLGEVNFQGKRVLEIGPASGFLTFWMEAQGAQVTCLEPDLDNFWDLVPGRMDVAAADNQAFRRHIERVRNAFWLAHEKFASKAVVVIGSACDVDASLGRFDLVVLSSVLLHTRLPTEIVHRCASVCDEAIIITERVFPDVPDAPAMVLEQRAGSGNLDTWWRFSPLLFQQLLAVYGFAEQVQHAHQQPYWSGDRWNDVAMFTLTARRSR